MTITINELKEKIIVEMKRLSNQLDALDGVTGDPVIHEYKPEIIQAPNIALGLPIPKEEVKANAKRKYIRSSPTNMKKTTEHSARYYLNDQYRGLTVGAATILAASRMGDKPFRASDIGRKIYDYRGVTRFSNMHSVIGSTFERDERFVRVDRGVYMWDDNVQTTGTHNKKLQIMKVE
jgi:hypothetical protein